MAMEYTEEHLNNIDRATLVQLFLVQQSQLQDIDRKLQLLLEQVAVLNDNRFGRSSEYNGWSNLALRILEKMGILEKYPEKKVETSRKKGEPEIDNLNI